MRLNSLRSKLLLTVFMLVIGTGAFVSFLTSHRYGQGLLNEAAVQAEHLAHALALESADMILINDMVSLQKLLDYQIGTHPFIAYLFVLKDGEVVCHTFKKAFPVGLLDANTVLRDGNAHLKRIVSTEGDRFMDIAFPILSGKAGVFRLGISEKPYQEQVLQLALQMVVITLAILIAALAVSYYFIHRVTQPLKLLAKAVEKVEEGDWDICLETNKTDEVGILTASFHRMICRIKDHTLHLERKTNALARIHRQTSSSLAIIRQIGAQGTLREVAAYLIGKFKEIVACRQIMLLVFSGNRERLFMFSEREQRVLPRNEFESDLLLLTELTGVTSRGKSFFKSGAVSEYFHSANRLAIFPIQYEMQLLGDLLVGCPENCQCDHKELEVVDLILKQTSGTIKRAAVHEEQIRDLHERIESTKEFSGMVGKHPQMKTVYKLIEDIAPTDASVSIHGESGTGKELVARAIHRRSLRSKMPFVVLNCSAYPVTLLESELFGHEKGAFTGATRQKIGRFEQAHGGTIFLDEIGEIPPSAQIKLLRVLQTQKFERLGGEKTISVNVRIVSATNKDLLQEVKAARFREDLYYRLNVIPISLPPLRDRGNDIPLLARHFLERFAGEQKKAIAGFSSEAIRQLLEYRWPGNVRELENSIEHAVALAKGDRIEVSDLPATIRDAHAHAGKRARSSSDDYSGILMEYEANLLTEVLVACGWNKKEAARRLGISRSTLYDKIKKYQISPTLH